MLTEDIVLNTGDIANYDGSSNNSWHEWFPIGYWYDTDGVNGAENVYFNGTFDGQGHTISGLYFNNASQSNVGLFGQTFGNSVIANVGIMNSYVKGKENVGSVCGINGYGSIINNCYNTGKVDGDNYVGGVCGDNGTGATLSNCYSTGKVSGASEYVGGVCGYTQIKYTPYGKTTNSYYLNTSCTTSAGGTAKTEAQFKSGEVAYLLNDSKSTGDIAWYMNNGMPTLDKTGKVVVYENGVYSFIEYKGTALTYTVDPTYTVTIPPTVTLGKDVTVSAKDVVIDEGKQVNVALTATSGNNNAFTVSTDKGATLTYAVTNEDGGAVNVGDTVLSVKPGANPTGEATLSFSKPDDKTVTYSGTYKGTVTFTVSVVGQPITFSLAEDYESQETKEVDAEVGMTWREWLASEYNTFGWSAATANGFTLILTAPVEDPENIPADVKIISSTDGWLDEYSWQTNPEKAWAMIDSVISDTVVYSIFPFRSVAD